MFNAVSITLSSKMEIKDCPIKVQKVLAELRKDHLEELDFFLKMSRNITYDQRMCKFSIVFRIINNLLT